MDMEAAGGGDIRAYRSRAIRSLLLPAISGPAFQSVIHYRVCDLRHSAAKLRLSYFWVCRGVNLPDGSVLSQGQLPAEFARDLERWWKDLRQNERLRADGVSSMRDPLPGHWSSNGR